MEPTIDEVKLNLRLTMKALMKNMTRLEHQSLSARISINLLNTTIWGNATTIALYYSRHDEPDTRTLLQSAWESKKQVALPKVESCSLGFYYVTHVSELTLGAFNLMEPNVELCRPCPLSEIDLIIVPGLAFDKSRSRLGRGKGYYDRALSKLPAACSSAGLFYAQQKVEQVPKTSHDMTLDYIVTEDGTFSANS